jgi:large subunit ribosomal protein L23
MSEEKKERKPAKAKKAAGGKKVAAADPRLYDLIERPVITEKSTMASEQGKVVFKVRPDATKPEIREAIEKLFNVNVTAVNTLVTKGKVKRFRGRIGTRSDVKKAIVTLKEGQVIDIAAGAK